MLLAAFGAMTTPMTAWTQTLRMRLTPEGLQGRLFALPAVVAAPGLARAEVRPLGSPSR